MENANWDAIIVQIIVLTASIITWKLVKDFYIRRFHKLVAHLIAIATASFMLISTMTLFVPRNYQRGATAEFELSLSSVIIVIGMVGLLYILFKFILVDRSSK